VDLGDRVVGEQVGGAAGGFEVVADVAGGLVAAHALHLGSDGPPLVGRREDAELDVVPPVGWPIRMIANRVLLSIS
jgi:hypothetical protein